MFEHFCWQPLSVLCQSATTVTATLTAASTTTSPVRTAAGKSKGKVRTRGKVKDKGKEKEKSAPTANSLCESLRATPSLQRFVEWACCIRIVFCV